MKRRPRTRWRAGRAHLAILTSLVLLRAAPGIAQEVRGRVTLGTSGEPVIGAFVSLLDPAGERAAGALTAADGRFRVAAPDPGRYTLRVEHLGYATHRSEPFDIGRDRVAVHDVALTLRPITLPEIAVVGERRCQAREDADTGALRLWEAARIALRVASWASRQSDVAYHIVRYSREIDPKTRAPRIGYREGRVLELQGVPWDLAPVDSLLRKGFVQRRPEGVSDLFVPSPEVFLSDAFLDSHCFRVRTDNPPEAALIGLHFEPVERRDVTDIEGTLWLRRSDLALRVMEYAYVAPRRRGSARDAGGAIAFSYLSSGLWLLREWVIRTRLTPLRRRSGHPLIEDGGRVVRVLDGDGEEIWADPDAAASAGAGNDGTGVESDGVGRPDSSVSSLAGLAAYFCSPRDAPAEETVDAVGFVVDLDGRPIAGARVVLRSTVDGQEISTPAQTDRTDTFVICRVPVGVDVVLEADHDDYITWEEVAQARPHRLLVRVLRLAPLRPGRPRAPRSTRGRREDSRRPWRTPRRSPRLRS